MVKTPFDGKESLPENFSCGKTPFVSVTGDPTWGNPSRWTQALWQPHDCEIKHARLLIISMLDATEHSHAPSPFPRLCLTHGKALTK